MKSRSVGSDPAPTSPSLWVSILLVLPMGLMIGVAYIWVWQFTLRGFLAAWLVGSLLAAVALVFAPLNRLRFPVFIAVMAIAGGLGGFVFAFLAGHEGGLGKPALLGAAYATLLTLIERRPANAA